MSAWVFSFVLGVWAFQHLAHLPNGWQFLLVFVLMLLLAYQRAWRFSACLAGWLWAGLFALWQLQSLTLAPELAGKELMLSGVVVTIPHQDEQKYRFDFNLSSAPKGVPKLIKLSWYHPAVVLEAGQHWHLQVKLKPVHGLLNPGGFDYEGWLFAQGIGATGYVRHAEQALLTGQDRPWQNVQLLRQRVLQQIQSVNTLHFPAFISALAMGWTDAITQAQWQILKDTGTLHLIAISGSHISLVVGWVFWLTRRFAAYAGVLRYSPPALAAIVALLAAAAYALLAGFSIPTQRALIMLSVVLSGVIWQRHILPGHTLALAMLIIVLSDPLAVLSPGFWLSFAAVALIFWMILGRLGRPPLWQSVLSMHGVMALGLAPLLLCLFQQLSLSSPLANLVAVPLVNLVVVPCALLALLVWGLIPQLAEYLLMIADVALGLLWRFLTGLVAVTPALEIGFSASVFASVLASIGVLLLLMPRGLPGRHLGLFLCLPLVFKSENVIAPGALRFTLLDVGQGLASVVRTAKHVLVFDTGIKFSPEADSGRQVIVPFLRQQGIDQVDSLIVSHLDNDHSGGATSLNSAYPAKSVLSSDPLALTGLKAEHCQQGQTWVWDEVEFRILSPQVQHFQGENDNSCVLQVKSRYGSILLTGDIEATAETWLSDHYGEGIHSEVLVAPHHGSKSSSSEPFLDAVKPKLILIPAGYRNPFHFPHTQVLQRYSQRHIPWISSFNSGAIQVDLKPEAMAIRAYREQVAKYWQQNSGQFIESQLAEDMP